MKEDLISVIIPVYNVEQYLEKCLNSVINQTYKNLEIILVDDGSTDSSDQICDEYAKEDSRIMVTHKKNEGVAATRNLGISKSNGEYITFVDSDDFVDKDYINMLYKEIKNNNCDISTCQNVKFKKNIEILEKKQEYTVEIFDSKTALINMLYQRKIDSSLWGKLYKSSVLKSEIIKNIKTFEDYDCFCSIFSKNYKICCISSQLYYYYIRENSLIHDQNTCNENYLIDILEENYNKTSDIEIKKAILSRLLDVNFSILCNKDKNSEQYVKSKKYIIRNRKKVLKDKHIDYKTKIAIIISYISFNMLIMAYKIFKVRN